MSWEILIHNSNSLTNYYTRLIGLFQQRQGSQRHRFLQFSRFSFQLLLLWTPRLFLKKIRVQMSFFQSEFRDTTTTVTCLNKIIFLHDESFPTVYFEEEKVWVSPILCPFSGHPVFFKIQTSASKYASNASNFRGPFGSPPSHTLTPFPGPKFFEKIKNSPIVLLEDAKKQNNQN